MKKFAVIVAAGTGSRMGNATPKQFLNILGKPVLAYALDIFQNAYEDIRLIVVAHPGHLQQTKSICSSYPGATVVAGGATRFASVRAGLSHTTEDGVVFIHDAVRCLLTKELVYRCYDAAIAHGNAVPAVSPVDSVRIHLDGKMQTFDRKAVRLIQTPQTFLTSIVINAYASAAGEDFTDDAAVVERSGIPIHLVEGEPTNVKMTYPSDLLYAELILSQRR